MKLFLDTSSLFKLYHNEVGTAEIENVFLKHDITHIFLSEITKIEFASTLWKKVRTKEISVEQARATIIFFETDFPKYHFIAADSLLLEQARGLINKYGADGLRTLDSIQLSTCITLASVVDVFFTADTLLKTILNKENLRTET